MNKPNDVAPLFKNHSQFKRQIRLDEDFTVCDIFSIRRAIKDGDPHYQTTYQDPNVGRYIIIKNNNAEPIKIYDLQRASSLPGGRALPDGEVRAILNELPSIIIEWLLDVSIQKHSNFVPPGFGWDGKFTQSEYNKRQTAGLLFANKHGGGTNIEANWLNEVLDEICRTPRNLLKLRWNMANFLPEDRYIKRTNSVQDKDYIFIYKDGTVELQKRKRIVGDINAYRGLLIPVNVDRVIELTYGVTCKENGQPAGIQVELWQDAGI